MLQNQPINSLLFTPILPERKSRDWWRNDDVIGLLKIAVLMFTLSLRKYITLSLSRKPLVW